MRAAAPGQQYWSTPTRTSARPGLNPGSSCHVPLGPAGAHGIILGLPRPGGPGGLFWPRPPRPPVPAAAAIPAWRVVATLPAVAALGADTGELPAKAKAVLAAGR